MECYWFRVGVIRYINNKGDDIFFSGIFSGIGEIIGAYLTVLIFTKKEFSLSLK